MDASHHMAAVVEVDLTTWQSPNTLADRFNAVPGLKTSAAFFSFLRANLVPPPSEMPSNTSTPVLGPTTQVISSVTPIATNAKGTKMSAHFPRSVSSPAAPGPAAPAAAGLDDIPPLSLGVLTTRADKVDALRLVADSIAQQRQTAARSLALHPLNLAVLVAAGALAHQLLQLRGSSGSSNSASQRRGGDLGSTVILLTGVVMSYLVAIRYATAAYLRLAEAVDWEYLFGSGGDDDSEQDLVLGTRFDSLMVGALILRLERDPSSSSSSRTPARRGVIRAWTTKVRFRRHGVGRDLLEEAVRVTRARCGRDAAVVFSRAHANSTMVLPEMYNAPFRQSQRLAERALDSVLASLGASAPSKRKR